MLSGVVTLRYLDGTGSSHPFVVKLPDGLPSDMA